MVNRKKQRIQKALITKDIHVFAIWLARANATVLTVWSGAERGWSDGSDDELLSLVPDPEFTPVQAAEQAAHPTAARAGGRVTS